MANSELLEVRFGGDGCVANTAGKCAAENSVRRKFPVNDNIYDSTGLEIKITAK